MYYRLSPEIALRSWQFVPRAYYVRNRPYAKGLNEEEWTLLQSCDGSCDIPESPLTADLEKRGLIVRCKKGEGCAEWSKPKAYEHRYFPKINFMITGRCNYNCLHCFNAADNAPLMTEWGCADALELLDEARDCGINAFTITGGEPMLHPNFMEIVRGIYERGMFLEELNTNGYFITEKILDELAGMGCRPLMKISFDGLGCHDWLRGHKGAEERTLAAMELCVKKGFRVMSQTQVHRRDLHVLMDTARRLNDIGVDTLRLIRTTEVPRWAENAPDSCLDPEEYYQAMLDFADDYKNSGLKMELIIWQFMKLYPCSKSYSLEAVLCPDGNFKPTDPVCKGIRGMVGVTSSGKIVPCLQMSGYLEEYGIDFGSLHEKPLREFLSGGGYLKTVCLNLHKMQQANRKCRECRFFSYCNGGCPALGNLYSGEFTGADISKCLFYENGWHHKVSAAMEGWKNLTPLPL